MTKKEQLYQYLLENSFDTPPTVRELCAALSVKSTSTIFNLLHMLEEEGLITLTKGKRRNIVLTNRKNTVKIPLVGTVAAGIPILAQQNIEEYITCEAGGEKDELFALRIKGDSMKDAGILDGDIVITRQTLTADDGTIVVALIEDEATVKRLYRKNGYIELHAENINYPPILVKEASLLGKVISVMRYYE